jgi:hypothetical protein
VKVAFKKSFTKDLRQIKDRAILQQVHDIIKAIESAQSPVDIKNLRKLSGASGKKPRHRNLPPLPPHGQTIKMG